MLYEWAEPGGVIVKNSYPGKAATSAARGLTQLSDQYCACVCVDGITH